VLESGAGTGKATLVIAPMLAAAGCSLTCVEPDPAMAALLERHLAAVEGLRAEVVRAGLEQHAETASGAAGGFGLLFAAQSWHWVAPQRRVADAASLLEPGGTLALVWNVARPHPPALRADLDAAYRDVAAGLDGEAGRDERPEAASPSVVPPASPQPRAVGCTPATRAGYAVEIEASGWFGPLSHRSRHWVSRHETEGWLSVLRTHSDHRLLPPDALEELLERIGQIIDRHGGVVEVEYDTVALLARRRAEGSRMEST
jgi:SAM-dependent methyltransferase